MHGNPARSWTVAQLAKEAALSRSSFFDRFTRAVGLPPMEYLLAWRMAVAKDLLRLQFGEHLQHRFQPPRRPAAGPLRARRGRLRPGNRARNAKEMALPL